ncbi:MAG: hypothetical protein A2521_16445 [Deltaproteobacteria bacterium RIFOXYD12_FULL_57_12]|nr:MAG: hypothetical protein A2521_16445 [Deltaproteobacteria bacterium RIFOXYD12_FULL_57_12]
MTSESQSGLHEMHLIFIGRLLAGVSHEFKNHLAVIKELNGLLGDLLSAQPAGGRQDLDRFRQIAATIEERIGQAGRQAGYLNRFAHRLDTTCSAFGVNDVLQEELSLCSWLARQQKIEVTLSLGADLPMIDSNSSLVQLLIFSLVAPCLESLAAGGRVGVATTSAAGAVRIRVWTEGALKSTGALEQKLQATASLVATLADELRTEIVPTFSASGQAEISFLLSSFSD